MKNKFLFVISLCFSTLLFAQDQEVVIENIIKEASENSQLEKLGHELLDVVGPRLVGTPEMKQAHDWAVNKYKDWEISAENQQWGEWKGWKRGITHIDLIEPRVRSLSGMQLAWSPSSGKKPIVAEVVILPEAKDSADFAKMMATVKGKLVMISMPQKTGRPDYNWEEFATEESFEKMKENRKVQSEA
ncbi:MAG TPA: hypothetical protein VK833_00015, partial [Gillisia sp.]|nr:hypothetical protein [Gillisia sp.]